MADYTQLEQFLLRLQAADNVSPEMMEEGDRLLSKAAQTVEASTKPVHYQETGSSQEGVTIEVPIEVIESGSQPKLHVPGFGNFEID